MMDDHRLLHVRRVTAAAVVAIDHARQLGALSSNTYAYKSFYNTITPRDVSDLLEMLDAGEAALNNKLRAYIDLANSDTIDIREVKPPAAGEAKHTVDADTCMYFHVLPRPRFVDQGYCAGRVARRATDVYLDRRANPATNIDGEHDLWLRSYFKAALAGKSEADAIAMADERLQEARDDVD